MQVSTCSFVKWVVALLQQDRPHEADPFSGIPGSIKDAISVPERESTSYKIKSYGFPLGFAGVSNA